MDWSQVELWVIGAVLMGVVVVVKLIGALLAVLTDDGGWLMALIGWRCTAWVHCCWLTSKRVYRCCSAAAADDSRFTWPWADWLLLAQVSGQCGI